MIAALCPSAAGAAPADAGKMEKKTPVERVAGKFERRIEQHKPVSFNASNTIYWSRKDDEDRSYDFYTKIPLVKRVGSVIRYFGIEQEGKTRESLDVFPLPEKVLRAQGIYDDFFHCGEGPNGKGEIRLSGQNKLPLTVIYFPHEEPEAYEAQVGETQPYNLPIVLIPPALPDLGTHCK